ncbi:flagellar motor switch protein FliM [Benzoatithermus flavus]|uniref:Flagellar motor switch protein FliM n=1 Tax=Benzoatithermus flavus TaxID=3108223 RepID=A0ABU8XXM6_9PROT
MSTIASPTKIRHLDATAEPRDVPGTSEPSAGSARTAPGASIVLLDRSRGTGPERWPALELVVDDLARRLTVALRRYTLRAGSVQAAGISTRSLEICLESVPARAVIAVFAAEPWGERGLLVIESCLIDAIVDLTLGGHEDAPPAPCEQRSLTAVGARFGERLIELTLEALGQAFGRIARVVFRYERMETRPELAVVAHPDAPCLFCRLHVCIGRQDGMLALLLPHAMLEPARDRLARKPENGGAKRSALWAEHLAHEVWRANVEIAVVLEERDVRLRDVLGLAVGSVLHLRARTDSPVRLQHEGLTMAIGRIGRSGDRLSVRVEAVSGRDEEDDRA